MGNTLTKYVIVNDHETGAIVSELLDDEYTLVISWVVGNTAHHILSKTFNDAD